MIRTLHHTLNILLHIQLLRPVNVIPKLANIPHSDTAVLACGNHCSVAVAQQGQLNFWSRRFISVLTLVDQKRRH